MHGFRDLEQRGRENQSNNRLTMFTWNIAIGTVCVCVFNHDFLNAFLHRMVYSVKM